MIREFKHSIKQYNLIDKGDKIVVGVSGGPDSLALLYLLNSLKRDFDLKLHVAHLDHALRRSSDKDRVFVEKAALKLGLPVTSRRIDIAGIAARGGSIEELARNARLSFLFDVARKIKADKIALGHNFDDQAETVLMRVIRGCGLYGLAAMLPKRNIAGYEIIRPLIRIKRKHIETFLRDKNIRPRRDPTNKQDIYLRNRVRNNLLPLLEKGYNKNIKEALVNLAESAGADYDYLAHIALKGEGSCKKCISLEKLRKQHPSMRRLVLRLAISRLKGDTRTIDFRHIKEIEDLVLNRPINSVVNLPKGISVIKLKKTLSFCRK